MLIIKLIRFSIREVKMMSLIVLGRMGELMALLLWRS